MTESQDANRDFRTDVLGNELNLATPPICPAPMPTQVIEFWTPGEIWAALLRSLAALRRLPAARLAVSSDSKSDEQAR